MSEQSEELEVFRDMVQRFLQQEVEPHYAQWETNHLMPKSFWQTMGAAGLLLVDLPEQYGAAGVGFEVSLMVQEEMCRHGFHSLATGYNIHANIVAPYLNNFGSQEQKMLSLRQRCF